MLLMIIMKNPIYGLDINFLQHVSFSYFNLITSCTITKIFILFLIIQGVLCLSSMENSILIKSLAFAQSYSNNVNGDSPSFPNNGADTDRAPSFLDAYWTNYQSSNSTPPSNNSVKKEVSPGEGSSTLAVVLVNKGRSDITGVAGYLTLPKGFEPIAGKNNGTSQSVASAYSIVKSGDTFVLYFDMNVLNKTKVGGYNTSLILKYTKINQIGQLVSTIDVPFRLTGKVILDVVSEKNQLIPSTFNPLKIFIQNKGSTSAAGVIATITSITSGSGITSSNTPSTLSNSGSNAGGSNNNTTNSNISTNTSNSQTLQSNSVSSSSSSSSADAVNIGATTFDIGTIPANSSSVSISPVIYPTASAGETVQNLDIQLTYGDAYGNPQTLNKQIGLIISPNPPQSVLNITNINESAALIITSGKIQNMSLLLANSDEKNPITNVVASLKSQSNTMQILGDSRWTIPFMPPQSKINLNTKAFASSTMVGQPASFTLSVDYISAGQSKTDNLNIGTYVKGDIKIRVYDVNINFIGGKPNLVGNLLNEGNTVALFTTVEMANNSLNNRFLPVLPPPQYLGDLSVDSPLPFSIPINLDNKTISTIKAGLYPIIFKITYSDDLKIHYELLLNSSVDFEPSQFQQNNAGGNSSGLFGFGISNSFGKMIIPITIVIVIVIVIAVFLVRKRRSKVHLARLQKSKDMEDFLDDFSSPTNTDIHTGD